VAAAHAAGQDAMRPSLSNRAGKKAA